MATVKVWDLFIRIFHWSLVASFVVAFLTSEERDLRLVHDWAGYSAATLVCLRLLWGVIGTRYARFSQFVRGPSATLRYVRDLLQGRELRYIGHNPAGAAMVVVLLVSILGVSLTGHLMTTDAFWGAEVMEDVHEILAYGMLGLIVFHVGGVMFESIRHRESLVKAMITGKKREATHRDIV